MSEYKSVARVTALQEAIEAKTGETYGDLADGVQVLLDGYGQGGGGLSDKILSYFTKFDPIITYVSNLPDPFVLNLPRCTVLGTLFNANYPSFKNLELYLASGQIQLGSIVGGGGLKMDGVENVKIRSDGSEVILVKNANFNYGFNCPTLKVIDCIFDFSVFNRAMTDFMLRPGESVEYMRFKANTLHVDTALSFAESFTDETIVSIANSIQTGTAKTLTLHATPKARCDEILGNVSQVTQEDGTTYDFFTADEAGTVTLTEFITTTKGWTLA